jgi:hypothetical protein
VRGHPGANAAGAERRNVVDAATRHAGEVVVRRGVAVEPHAGEVGALGQQPLGRHGVEDDPARPGQALAALAERHRVRRIVVPAFSSPRFLVIILI